MPLRERPVEEAEAEAVVVAPAARAAPAPPAEAWESLALVRHQVVSPDSPNSEL